MNLLQTLSDTVVMTKRNLTHYRRVPLLIFFSTVQPTMFLLLFTFVFGGAIQTGTGSYIAYLLPAILVQTVIFGSMNTAIGLSEDMKIGLIDRFRSLPMSRFAVLAGRTLADSVRNIFTMSIMIGVGYLIGFRLEVGIQYLAIALASSIFFGFALMWLMCSLGLSTKDGQTAQMAAMVFSFPLTFASSAYVPTETMPSALKLFANNSPVTHATDAARELILAGTMDGSFTAMMIWTTAIFLVFAPLAVLQFKRMNR